MSLIDDFNRFVHAKYVPKKKERTARSRKVQILNSILLGLCVLFFAGGAGIIFLSVAISPVFLLLALPWVAAQVVGFQFAFWYEKEYKL